MDNDDSMNDGLTAWSLVIDSLEAELGRARALKSEFELERCAPSALLPIRHFCASLVETAVELARQVASISATEQTERKAE